MSSESLLHGLGVVLAAAAASGTGGRGSSAAAQGGLPQFGRQVAAHGVHGIQHLIKGDQLVDAAEGHLCCHQGVGYTGSVAVLAGVFHQTAHRVTYQTQHVPQHGRGCIQTLLGGTPQQCLDAASTVLRNMLGLVCDPVGGLVEYPCQNRNAAGVANALVAAEMALSGIHQLIPFDQMLDTMYTVGRHLPAELRETALGGCAATPAACAACGRCG